MTRPMRRRLGARLVANRTYKTEKKKFRDTKKKLHADMEQLARPGPRLLDEYLEHL